MTEFKRRNEWILRAVLDGATMVDTALAMGISPGRVQQICGRQVRLIARRVDADWPFAHSNSVRWFRQEKKLILKALGDD